MFAGHNLNPVEIVKSLLKLLWKAVYEFLKKRIMAVIWGWAFWAVCVVFAVVVVACLVAWYFLGR